MQHVGRILPLNGYLHRIQRHKTGHCPWCPGERETQAHFQCLCPKFEPHRTAAHHKIVNAVLASLKESTKGFQFWHETTFQDLPWLFKWKDAREQRKQERRRPDAVAWNALTGALYFLEFSRPMDQDGSLAAAADRKGCQYDAAVDAIMRGQRSREGRARSERVHTVRTIPLVFGVRGSVEYADLKYELGPFNIKRLDKTLAAGVRAAIEGASDMVSARTAALPTAHLEQGVGARWRRRRRRTGSRGGAGGAGDTRGANNAGGAHSTAGSSGAGSSGRGGSRRQLPQQIGAAAGGGSNNTQ